ncbi:integration host factor subunit alpha [Azoarcus sp. KH32C]|uniref:integration host factor subunit alpha n=1 Tax=Azoarcus sp. KH32C TaxID=748247 RepID=UPI00023866EB|nr:integration host factor subunit alpha [Azoarcus sp. KH32C]BAL23685.1 integration host factor, alpha subunit [Azoarcus sp. KH32C]
MTLTKADLIQLVVDNVGLNKREAAEMVEAFFEEISSALEAGDDVKLSGFGGFQLRVKPERPGRNPKTGEGAVIAARRVVTFHPSQKLKIAVGELASKKLETRGLVSGVTGTSRIGRRVVAEGV